MEKIFKDLFSHYERGLIEDAEYTSINNKIISERKYFESVLTPEDVKRLDGFENLFSQSETFEETAAYVAGFKLGVRLICAALGNNE